MEERYNDTKKYLRIHYPMNVFEDNASVTSTSLLIPWTAQCFHNFYQQYQKEWDNSTALLLEVGGGPCIYSYVSAVPYVAKIIHSDYVKANLDEVSMWKNKDPDAFDWSPYFKYVIQKLEGRTSHNAILEREKKLRDLLTTIPCDLKADVVAPAVDKPVDILSSNFCLATSADNLEEYKIWLKKFYDMVVSKGFFVSLTSIGLTWYKFDDLVYHASPSLSLEDVKQHYKEAGFDVVRAKLWSKPMKLRNTENDTEGFAFVIARK